MNNEPYSIGWEAVKYLGGMVLAMMAMVALAAITFPALLHVLETLI